MARLTEKQLESHIRKASVETINVTITIHAKSRMRERAINNSMLFDVLRNGVLRSAPEQDMKHEGLKCRMERYVCGRDIVVVANVSPPSQGLVVITVYEIE